VRDEVRHDRPKATGTQRAGHPQEDRDVVLEHLLPDVAGKAEVSTLERDPLHARQDLVGRQAVDGERLDRLVQEARLLHASQL
jgi:hypothetical protein